MESFKLLDDIEKEEAEKKAKELQFAELERTLRKTEEYRKEKRESQKWLLPFLLKIGQENIKTVKVKNKKGDKLWDYSQV